MILGNEPLSEVSLAQAGGNAALLSGSAGVTIRAHAALTTHRDFPSHASFRIRAHAALTTTTQFVSSGSRFRIGAIATLTTDRNIKASGRLGITAHAALAAGTVLASSNSQLRMRTSTTLSANSSVPFVIVSEWPDLRLMFVDENDSPVRAARISVSDVQPGDDGTLGFSFMGFILPDDVVVSGELTRTSATGDVRSVIVGADDGKTLSYDVIGTDALARYTLNAYLQSGAKIVMSSILLPLDFQ